MSAHTSTPYACDHVALERQNEPYLLSSAMAARSVRAVLYFKIEEYQKRKRKSKGITAYSSKTLYTK